MLYTQCFKRFEEKSKQRLPDFLYNKRTVGATAILNTIVAKDLQIPYEQYIDIFKYMGTNDIVLPTAYIASNLDLKSGMTAVIKIAQIIGDNPNPYTLNYSKVQSSYLYREACYGNSIKAMILQVIAIRQAILNDKTYTVLEDFIKRLLNSTTITPEETSLVVNMAEILTSASIEYQGLANAQTN